MMKIKNFVRRSVALTALLATHNAFATNAPNAEAVSTSSTNTVASSLTGTSNNNYESVFANLALHCIHQEFPNVVKHMMNSADDVKAPNKLYPAFYGCLDWHSSVHGHWLLGVIAGQM